MVVDSFLGRFSFGLSRLLDNVGLRIQPREPVLVSPGTRVFDVLAEERAQQQAMAELRHRELEEKRHELERRFGYVPAASQTE